MASLPEPGRLPDLTFRNEPSEDDPLKALNALLGEPWPVPPLPSNPVPPIVQHAGAAVKKCGAAAAAAIADLNERVRADAAELIEFLDLLENDIRSRTSLAVDLVERFGSDAKRTHDIAQGLRSKELLP